MRNKYIACGSALCGGASYALLEKFFRSFCCFACADDHPQYEHLNQLAREAYEQHKAPLQVHTCFCGKRHDPGCTGSIMNITTDNFTPGQLALGFIQGICQELYDFYQEGIEKKALIVASGNAIQKVPVYRHVIADLFQLPVRISLNREEASIGAALFSAVAAGLLPGLDAFSDFIQYE